MATLLDDLRSDEGWSPYVYRDSHPEKYQTIGYGFLVDSRKGVGLPKEVAEFWLEYAVNERLTELRSRWPGYDLQSPEVQRALGNMAYQLGVSGLLKFGKMLAALDRGDRAIAAAEALDSTWAKQTPARARRVATLIRGSP